MNCNHVVRRLAGFAALAFSLAIPLLPDSALANCALVSTEWQCSSGNFNGTVSSSETLQLSGGGDLQLDGSAVVGGNVTILGSNMLGNTSNFLGHSSAANSSINVVGGSITFNQEANGTYAGALNGGTLNKLGTSRLILTGNTSSNATHIAAGSLEISSDEDRQMLGNLSGTGALVKSGTGRLQLAPNATGYTGVMQVLGGTLVGSSSMIGPRVVVNSGASLELAQDHNGSYSGTIAGSGNMIKTGTGKLTLTGNYSIANANVSAGELEFAGNMSSQMNVNVSNGARLSGIGNFGNLNVAGTFAPQSYTGVNANSISFSSGSVFEVRMTDNGSADRLAVTGTAALNSATLRVLPIGNGFSNEVTSTILTAGNISGTFGNTVIDTATFRATLNYQPQQVQLTLQQVKKLREAVTSTPSYGPAEVLDRISAGTPSSGMTTLLQNLYSLDQPSLDKAMHTLSGA